MVSNEEIREAVFSMGALKAPGPDGLHALFFQSQWETIGNTICDFVKGCFTNPRMITSINANNIVLIPKTDKPETLKRLRPISLCNTIYKVFTKIIASWIKLVLNYLISPYHCSFIPSRHGTDNIIITQEVIHSMEHMKGKRGYMAVKVDLGKRAID